MPEAAAFIPLTEQENPHTAQISSLPTEEILRLMNEEDAGVPLAVEQVLAEVTKAVDGVVQRLQAGGRLFYIGTGTSGRLGVLDASECPPTFGVSPDLVQAILPAAMKPATGQSKLPRMTRQPVPAIFSIAVLPKRTCWWELRLPEAPPYTVGAVRYAREAGALTIAITCVPGSAITDAAEISIVPVVGPEVIAGSTRMKAGTAQKLVLNMISTATMIRLGYVTGNRMTNVQTRNVKLQARAIRILMGEAGLDEGAATKALATAGGKLPVALVMAQTGCDLSQANAALLDSGGVVSAAVGALRDSPP
jgi:N-acetylmuramic acid 6-phosphate etherase